jgi:hypothetical protein
VAKWNQLRLKTVLELSAEKLTTLEANEAKIKDLKAKEDFASEEHVKAEEIKFRLKVMKSKEVSSIINSKNYLSKDDLKLKKEVAEKETQSCHACQKQFTNAELFKLDTYSTIVCLKCHQSTYSTYIRVPLGKQL